MKIAKLYHNRFRISNRSIGPLIGGFIILQLGSLLSYYYITNFLKYFKLKTEKTMIKLKNMHKFSPVYKSRDLNFFYKRRITKLDNSINVKSIIVS